MKQRIDIEWVIANRVIDDLLAAGFLITVCDGEEGVGDDVLTESTDKAAILEAMASTDEDFLHVTKSSEADLIGWVRLIYGNGIDLISDYTTNLEDALKGVNGMWDKLNRLSSDTRHGIVEADAYNAVFGNGN